MTNLYPEPEITQPIQLCDEKGLLNPNAVDGAGVHAMIATYVVIGREKSDGIIGLSSAPHIFFQ